MSTATATPATASFNALNSSASTPARQLNMTTAARSIDAQRKPGSPGDAAQRKSIPPKAWGQGTNPITQRPSNPSAVSGSPNPPKPSSRTETASSGETASPMRHLSDRMMYLLANLTGLPGMITLKNGEKYAGVLSGTSLDPSELRYVFKMVKKRLPANHAQTNGTANLTDDYVGVGDYHVMSFDMSDVADFHVNHVVLDKSQTKGQNGAAGFRTDADISGNTSLRERNLQRWEPAEMDADLALESTGNPTDWDQFSTNERLFGLRSNYDEAIYTTTINKNDPQYAAKAARAEKIAREIEASSALNSHVREERGGPHLVDDTGADEEDKYSGVRRDFAALTSGQSNRYTPPARRAPTAHSTVHGAPVDPAIISSLLARPDATGSPAAQRTASPAADQSAASETTRKEAIQPEAAHPTPAQTAAASHKPAAKEETKPTVALRTVADLPQKPSHPIKSGVAALASRKAGRPHDATTTVEHDLLDSFKQFSAAEKLRMSERQRAFARENKAVKLNDLKKFAQNFKLSTPVPSDLVPILAKDETKQQAIVERALRQAQETKTMPAKPAPAPAPVEAKPAARPGPKVEPSTASPNTNADRQQSQRSRPNLPAYASASMREPRHQNATQVAPRNPQGMLGSRLQMNQQQLKQQANLPFNGAAQPAPAQDTRVPPTGPSQPSNATPTPSSTLSSRFNVRANEFKPNPAANTFLPGGSPGPNSASRPNSAAKQEAPKLPLLAVFFHNGQRPAVKPLDVKASFNAISRMEKEAQASEKSHGSHVPSPYRTPPTWDFPAANTDKGYMHFFEHASGPSSAPQHGLNNGAMPHQHQMSHHHHHHGPQGMPQGSTPQHTPRGPPVQPHMGHNQHHYEAPHMQMSQSSPAVQPSRPMPPFMYGAQPQHMSGYPQQVQVPPYGMSPSVQHVGLRAAQGGHFIAPPGPAMGGHMMTNQPSNGPFMGIPGSHPMPMYTATPAPGYPQYPAHLPGPNANGFSSPRPGAPMMSHQGSQQGHLQQAPMMYMQPGAPAPPMYPMQAGSLTPVRGPFAQLHQGQYASPQPHHHYPHQHRGTPSGSYSQPMMQQHSIGQGNPPTGPTHHGLETPEEAK